MMSLDVIYCYKSCSSTDVHGATTRFQSIVFIYWLIHRSWARPLYLINTAHHKCCAHFLHKSHIQAPVGNIRCFYQYILMHSSISLQNAAFCHFIGIVFNQLKGICNACHSHFSSHFISQDNLLCLDMIRVSVATFNNPTFIPGNAAFGLSRLLCTIWHTA